VISTLAWAAPALKNINEEKAMKKERIWKRI
jgi:hypothetical protein